MITIDKELLIRLPKTFVPALNEQLNKWDLLFPVEQRTLKGQLDYLAGLPAHDLDQLFGPVKAVEAKMQLPAWWSSSDRVSISGTSMLVRSAYYPQWRSEVEKVFAGIDDGIEAANGRKPRRNVIVCLLPAGLPLHSGSPWPRLARAGRTLELRTAFSEGGGQFLRALALHTDSAADPVERTWVFEASEGVGRALTAETQGLTALSFEGLAALRKSFLARLNTITKDLHAADQAFDDLRRLDMAALLGPKLGRDPRLGSFIRDLFLSGNGALLFANPFVEWGASEAMRRAQPQLLICSFGIRSRMKPFSSLAVFEDQRRANPEPEQDDPAGSLIDAQILAEYVHLATLRLPSYNGQTLSVFAIEDSNSVLLLGQSSSSDWPSGPLALSDLSAGIVRWMEERV